jgi:hypothetical protein
MAQDIKTPPQADDAIIENNADLTPADLRKDVWGGTGSGEEVALREAMQGTEAETEDMSDLVAAETPDTVRQISDPHIYTEAEKNAKKPA